MSKVIYLEDLRNEFDALLKMPVDPDRNKFHRYSDPNAIIDEDKTVRWNREEVQRRNDEYRAERDRLYSLYCEANENCVKSAKRYIMDELGIDYDKASVVWNRLYDDDHAYGYQEVLNCLNEEIDYLSRILGRQ